MSATTPEILQQNGVTVIAPGPEFENIDETNLADLERSILATVDAADPPRVVVDLPHTKFFGSSFIAVLLAVRSKLNAREGGLFGICGLTPYCDEVLRMTRFDKLCRLFPTREEALAELGVRKDEG